MNHELAFRWHVVASVRKQLVDLMAHPSCTTCYLLCQHDVMHPAPPLPCLPSRAWDGQEGPKEMTWLSDGSNGSEIKAKSVRRPRGWQRQPQYCLLPNSWFFMSAPGLLGSFFLLLCWANMFSYILDLEEDPPKALCKLVSTTLLSTLQPKKSS